MKKKEKKEKKEKIVYIDDGRTIADMSGIHDGRQWLRKGTVSSPREIWRTYWAAFRMMLMPALVFSLGLLLIFVILYVLFAVM